MFKRAGTHCQLVQKGFRNWLIIIKSLNIAVTDTFVLLLIPKHYQMCLGREHGRITCIDLFKLTSNASLSCVPLLV